MIDPSSIGKPYKLEGDFPIKNASINPSCPACQQKRMHREEEWAEFHPLNRTGRTKN